MRFRILAGVVCVATALSAASALAAPAAQAELRPYRLHLDPLGRFFGFSSSPVPRTTVSYPGNHKPGTIIINTRERRLYLITRQRPGAALRHRRRARRHYLARRHAGIREARVAGLDAAGADAAPRSRVCPRYMPGGPDNPLGARALYLGSSLYRIHGSNEPETIGQAVSSGCFRLTNEDVIDLYNRVQIGATVIVQH